MNVIESVKIDKGRFATEVSFYHRTPAKSFIKHVYIPTRQSLGRLEDLINSVDYDFRLDEIQLSVGYVTLEFYI